MAEVKAVALEALQTQVSDASDTLVVFDSHDAFSDGAGWIDVSAFSTLTVDVEAGAAGADFTIKAKRHPDQTEWDFYAKATTATGRTAIVDGSENIGNILGVSYIRFYEDGTDTQSQTIVVNAE